MKPSLDIQINPKTIASINASYRSPFLFHDLSNDEIQEVVNKSLFRKLNSDMMLFQQGDESKYLYFIIRGSVKIFRCSADGNETTIRMLENGETFMEAVLFMDGKSPIAAQTIEESEVLMIPKSFVKDKVMHDNQFAYNLLRIVTQHYKNAIQQVDSISTKNPVERVGYFLLKLRTEQSEKGINPTDEILLPFPKSMIANYLSMTPETFSRALKKLQNLGLRVEQDHIILTNSFALCHFCDSDIGHFCHRHETDDCPLGY